MGFGKVKVSGLASAAGCRTTGTSGVAAVATCWQGEWSGVLKY